jgi:MFS family permease
MSNPVSLEQGRSPIDVRIRMSALWVATMLVFLYVDLFSMYREDFRQDLDEGQIFVFEVGQPFLLGINAYVIIPSVMAYLTLVMPRRLNRIVSIVIASMYAITIAGAAIGEWAYFVLGSLVEVVLLAIVIHHAWTWREFQPQLASQIA